MSNEPIQDGGSSRILQGCLFGAVAMFVILLVAMIVLAYLRFQEATGRPSPPAGPQIEAAPPTAP